MDLWFNPRNRIAVSWFCVLVCCFLFYFTLPALFSCFPPVHLSFMLLPFHLVHGSINCHFVCLVPVLSHFSVCSLVLLDHLDPFPLPMAELLKGAGGNDHMNNNNVVLMSDSRFSRGKETQLKMKASACAGCKNRLIMPTVRSHNLCRAKTC